MITTRKVTIAQTSETQSLPDMINAPLLGSLGPYENTSLIAAPAKERPISATVGPITAGGISLLIQATPTYLITSAIIT